MSTNAPQKLSVKRKRGEVPVESLLIADSPKRLKTDGTSTKRKLDTSQDEDNKRTKAEDSQSGRVVWRLLRRPDAAQEGRETAIPQTPTTPTARRFHVSRTAGNVILLEHKGQEPSPQQQQQQPFQTRHPDAPIVPQVQAPPTEPAAATPRKRPSARASQVPLRTAHEPKALGTGPSEATIRAFENFSREVESGLSPSRPKPRAPKKRYSERHPAEAYVLAHPDAMDLDTASPVTSKQRGTVPADTDEYVYDTYVLETLPSETLASAPESLGTVGYIVLTAEDEEWWYDNDGSTDREFDTDDEDSNAEEYYANDYPEDELSEDDEFDRSPYKHYRDENDDLYDFERDVVGSDEERSDAELELGGKVLKGKSIYWGRSGED